MPIFVDNLKKNGKIDDIHLTIAIVGSRKLEQFEEEYINQGWGLMSPNLTIYGFDADQDENAENISACQLNTLINTHYFHEG